MNRYLLDRASRLAIVLAILLPATSCGILDPEEVDEIRVVNRTEAPVFIQVWELETAYAVDPAPFFTLDPATDPVLAPGAFHLYQPEDVLGDYQTGKGVAIFVFEVQEEVAYFRTVVQVTGPQLRNREGRVRIDGF